MAIKLYFDEHVDPAIASALRRRGVDVLTAQEAGLLGVADERHLQLAISQNRVIFTQDTDFLRINSKGISHRGIVYIHQNASIGKIIQGLLLIYQVVTEGEMENRVEFL